MKHKIDWGPGYRFFYCDECKHEWKEMSRHCESPSTSYCPNCRKDNAIPIRWEPHYEWRTDKAGNLIEPIGVN